MDLTPRSGARGVPQALALTVGAACPGFVADRVLHRSATSVLLEGAVWGEPAVAKVLTSTVPFWRETFAREIDSYRYFAAHRPPFRVPALIAADELAPLLVLERLPGRPLSTQRNPDEEISPRRLAALFTLLGRVNGWRAPAGVRPAALDYQSRIDRCRRDQLLTGAESRQLSGLLDSLGDGGEFCHGDVVPPHVLRPGEGLEEGGYALVDWAFGGMFLPGFDLAKVWTVLRTTYGVRSEIEERARSGGDTSWHPFLVNLVVVLAQELRNQGVVGGRREQAQHDWRLLLGWLAATG